jgi:hypothetical protein
MFEHFDIGVEFIDDNNGDPGVRLRKSPKRRVSTGRDVSAKRTQFLCSKENRRLEPTLEAAGVDFIEENGGGPGVRLRKPTRQKSDEPTLQTLRDGSRRPLFMRERGIPNMNSSAPAWLRRRAMPAPNIQTSWSRNLKKKAQTLDSIMCCDSVSNHRWDGQSRCRRNCYEYVCQHQRAAHVTQRACQAQ